MEKKALSVALAAAVVGFGLLQLYMHHFEAEATGGEKLSVLVVTRDLQAGDTLDRASLASRGLPQAYVESRHIRVADLDRVLGQRLAAPAKADEALLWTDLESLATPVRTLSTLVQEGMRAVSLHLSRGSLGNMLRPGDRVDVLWIANAGNNQQPAAAPRTLLENVLVLAIGAQLTSANDATAAARSGDASQVTLSVTSDQGSAIALAETQGSLRLLLRNPDDISTSTAAAR